ncbi:uncharacterized protein LOC121734827 isoform X2 [Aricia agestis]|uniref:uncharacterized protein LOC121734827 isoform X2 n=1 Tax=Aricia agestis TaxID=91739 RepID=UPI001C2087D8|nr:uncharacterized protein LOC121734827 isoform X2 [Aricia agestis]
MNSPNSRNGPRLDLNAVEMVFGTPTSPVNRLDTHLIANERTRTEPTKDSRRDDTPSQPLLEPEKDKPTPPLAGPEIDDLGDSTRATTPDPYPGIDDGLLEPNNNNNDKPGHDDDDKPDGSSDGTHPMLDEGVGTDDDGTNGFEPRFGEGDRPISPMIPGSIPDVNTYQQKKNLAQGMMDLALLSANANQLRYVLESSTSHPYYYPSLTFIALSIIFQIAVGVGLIMNSQYNVKDDKDICKADKINNLTVLGIFLITIVNVFITSFSVATPNSINSVVQSNIQQAG